MFAKICTNKPQINIKDNIINAIVIRTIKIIFLISTYSLVFLESNSISPIRVKITTANDVLITYVENFFSVCKLNIIDNVYVIIDSMNMNVIDIINKWDTDGKADIKELFIFSNVDEFAALLFSNVEVSIYIPLIWYDLLSITSALSFTINNNFCEWASTANAEHVLTIEVISLFEIK